LLLSFSDNTNSGAVPQFYCDVLPRQAQYPQPRDLASKMDKMYTVWWEYLHVFIQGHGPPFIDSVVLRDIAAHCARVRPQLQVPTLFMSAHCVALGGCLLFIRITLGCYIHSFLLRWLVYSSLQIVADEFCRKMELPRAGHPPTAPSASGGPVVNQRSQLTTAEQAERFNNFCDSFSRLFTQELSMNSMAAKDVRRCLLSILQKQVSDIFCACGTLRSALPQDRTARS
jgi:hypothetical protein